MPTSSSSTRSTTASQGSRGRLAFALDYPDLDTALKGASAVTADVGVFKVGLELFIQSGPEAVRAVRELGSDVFLDLKLHDIQKTVERAVGTAAQLGARYLTVHAGGGPGMLESAAQRAESEGTGLTILAVTVLTSLDQSDLAAVGVETTPSQQVHRLAQLAKSCGVGGLVCSSAEVQQIRQAVGPKMVLVTPGIRPAGAAVGDQKRVGTPAEAIEAGSSLLVVGRPIRDADSPSRAAAAIRKEIADAL